jgi:hypothetical protein
MVSEKGGLSQQRLRHPPFSARMSLITGQPLFNSGKINGAFPF